MIRFSNWPTRLASYFEECAVKRFAYGEFDCVLFTCGALKAMTGFHPLKEYIGKYNNEMGAAKQMKIFSSGGIQETAEKVCASMALVTQEMSFAKRGDPVLVPFKKNQAFGIVDLDGRMVRAVEAEQGLIRVPVSSATHCWSFN